MARITIYKNSVFASLVSISGYLCMLAGFALAFGGAIFGGIFMFLLGMGLAALASIISSRVQFRKWIRKLKKDGIIDLAKENTALAIQIFDANPTKQTLHYIRKLNPTAAGYIDQHLAAQKSAV
jgi:hypothetical protein